MLQKPRRAAPRRAAPRCAPLYTVLSGGPGPTEECHVPHTCWRRAPGGASSGCAHRA